MIIAPVVLRPVSVGSITLRTANTFDQPLIDAAYFTDPEGLDKQVMLEGVKLTARVAALAPLSESIIENVLPGNLEEKTDEEIMAFISKCKSALSYRRRDGYRGGQGSKKSDGS
jgi:choline dehydrogenase-like flavoprotein